MNILNRLRRQKPPSGKVAQERLRLVLAHDRANISPGMLDKLKDEIITVISNHIPIDAEGVQVTYSEGPRQSRLVADIPLKSRQTRRKR